jgi:hypothetical protein
MIKGIITHSADAKPGKEKHHLRIVVIKLEGRGEQKSGSETITRSRDFKIQGRKQKAGRLPSLNFQHGKITLFASPSRDSKKPVSRRPRRAGA